MIFKRNAYGDYILYFALLLITGYAISNFSFQSDFFNRIGSLVWLIIFLILTFYFKTTRELVIPLLNIKPFKEISTLLFIIFSLILFYFLLQLSIHFEILINHNLIFYYKNGLLGGEDVYGLIDVMIYAPIWEEIFFRGILLFTLSKLLKPIWAIIIVSIIFAFFHPFYLVISLVAGIILSLMTLKTNSLIPSMVTHSIWNLYTGKLFLYF